MALLRAALLRWLLSDVVPHTLTAVGFAERVPDLQASAQQASNLDGRVRLLHAVRETLRHLSARERQLWAATAALSCVERILEQNTSGNALVLAIAERAAELSGIEMPQLAKSAAAPRRRAACRP